MHQRVRRLASGKILRPRAGRRQALNLNAREAPRLGSTLRAARPSLDPHEERAGEGIGPDVPKGGSYTRNPSVLEGGQKP